MTTELPRITYGKLETAFREEGLALVTYHHAQSDLLSTVLLLHSIVQHNVQEDLEDSSAGVPYASRIGVTYIVATQDAEDFAAAVQLNEQSLVEVLG